MDSFIHINKLKLKLEAIKRQYLYLMNHIQVFLSLLQVPPYHIENLLYTNKIMIQNPYDHVANEF